MPTLDDYPRTNLRFGPSPVHRLDRLSAHLGGVSVWAKREDVNSGRSATVLYAHLGGQPALNAYASLFA